MEITLFEPANNAVMVQRIEALEADSRPQWGKMNVTQMLAHCRKPLLVASGELKLKRNIIGKLFGKMAKKKYITGPAPFGKGSPTDPHFLEPDAADFSREQSDLIAAVKNFAEAGPSGLTQDPHPFFGPLSTEDWDRLMWKHLDHHMRQFGV